MLGKIDGIGYHASPCNSAVTGDVVGEQSRLSDCLPNIFTSLLGLFHEWRPTQISPRITLPHWSFTFQLSHVGAIAGENITTSAPEKAHQTPVDEYRHHRQMSTYVGRASGSKSRRQVDCGPGYFERNGLCDPDPPTPEEIGNIVIIVILSILLLVAVWWVIRHQERVSRFINKFRRTREPKNKEVDGGMGGGTMTTELDSGNVGAGHAVVELSPQERPQQLEEWGRHGSRGHELTGSYGAHGASELDGNPVVRN